MLMARPGFVEISTREAALGLLRALLTQKGILHKANLVCLHTTVNETLWRVTQCGYEVPFHTHQPQRHLQWEPVWCTLATTLVQTRQFATKPILYQVQRISLKKYHYPVPSL